MVMGNFIREIKRERDQERERGRERERERERKVRLGFFNFSIYKI
jgi:hypothetical protein